jgi:hypothetical protein
MNTLVRNLVLALLAVGTLAAAGDQAAPPPREPAPAQGEDAAPPSAAKPTPTPTPQPAPTADAEEQLEEFVPTEEVPADQAVSFPVDI